MSENYAVMKIGFGSLSYEYIEEEVMYTGEDFLGKQYTYAFT